jgi:hypothetical protein
MSDIDTEDSITRGSSTELGPARDAEDDDAEKSVLHYAAVHITMPPGLPQQGHDLDTERAINSRMCDLMQRAAADYGPTQRGQKLREFWKAMSKTFKSMSSLVSAPLEKDKVEKSLKFLRGGGELKTSFTQGRR